MNFTIDTNIYLYVYIYEYSWINMNSIGEVQTREDRGIRKKDCLMLAWLRRRIIYAIASRSFRPLRPKNYLFD